jgi:2-polyprenyl-3-methyl-5-hydroxy-6-metoxy-1,4-benzoquinol methylase
MANEDEAVPSGVFFQFAEAGNGPWEIGRPQSVITQLVAQGIFQGEVLDIGCGIADNAIYIASNAKHVHLTGVDLVNS